jgi:hypothetical protein
MPQFEHLIPRGTGGARIVEEGSTYTRVQARCFARVLADARLAFFPRRRAYNHYGGTVAAG